MADCRPCNTPYDLYDDSEWSEHGFRQARQSGTTDDWMAKAVRVLADWNKPRYVRKIHVIVQPAESVAVRFYRLAADWSANTGHISSVSDLVSHQSYQEIIKLGWGVVPYLLEDLQQNKRFWFPALFAITKVRPFDPRDANNSQRMTEAWIRWGKRKGLI
jgi:hypothetical protein